MITQRNYIIGITFKIFFSTWWMINTLTANQSPSCLKELKHLKQQMTKLQHMLIINMIMRWFGHLQNYLYSYYSGCEPALSFSSNIYILFQLLKTIFHSFS